MGDPARAAVLEAIAVAVAAAGADLEDVIVTRAGRRELVRVVVDRDGGIDLDAVAEISRTVGEALDDPAHANAFHGAYVLEVTSPGVDRPLVEPRHWRRSVGRLVQVGRADGSSVTGRVTAAGEATASLDVDGVPVEIAYADVERAVVQVEFTRDAAESAADDAEGDGA